MESARSRRSCSSSRGRSSTRSSGRFPRPSSERSWTRYSFLGADPLMVLTAKSGRLTLKRGARTERLPDGDPLPAVRELLGQFEPVPVPGLPRFQGGAVGYLAYDMVHHMERLPRTI